MVRKSGLIQKLRWWLIRLVIGRLGVVANVTIYGELFREADALPFLAWRSTFQGYDQAPGFVNKELEFALWKVEDTVKRWAAMSEKYEALRAAVRQVGELSGLDETMDSHLEIYHGMEY